MRVKLVDPSAYTPPYDHALCHALAQQGADVELITSEFAYGDVPAPDGYRSNQFFYRHARGPAGSKLRLATKLAEHVPDMLRLRRSATRSADVVHFQWLSVQPLDVHLLPRTPLVLTAHDLFPREPRPGQVRAQRRLYDAVDAVIVHSEAGRTGLLDGAAIDPSKVHVVHHGAFTHLAATTSAPLAPELTTTTRPVVLFFGLIRPYKGVDVLLDAWRDITDAELWVVGRPRMDTSDLKAKAPPSVRFIERFVSDVELPAFFDRADIVVLPYKRTERIDASGVLFTALGFGKAIVVTDVGGFGEVASTGAATLVAPDDASALTDALKTLIDDPAARAALQANARAVANGPYSWSDAAAKTLKVYETAKPTESAP